MKVGNQSIDVNETTARRALFDSGTSALVLTDPAYKILVKSLLDNDCYANCNTSISRICCKCSKKLYETLPNITININGFDIKMNPEYYLAPDPTNKVP